MTAQLHILTRVVVRRENKVLLAQAAGAANTFLPGGHLELGESLKTCLARELQEETGLEARIGHYLGLVEHTWEDDTGTNYELNHLFEASLPTLAAGENPPSLEAHLHFFWAGLDKLAEYGLEPYPLQHLLKRPAAGSAVIWASTLLGEERR